MRLDTAREMVSAEVLREATRSSLPLPGLGSTAARWERFTSVARQDLPLAKLVEPHHDALAIMAELGHPEPGPGTVWAVWAAEPPTAVLSASESDDGWVLSGTKAYCSGSSIVTHALVTAATEGGPRLFAIDLSAVGIGVDERGAEWVGHGMRRAGTRALTFVGVPARAVGRVGDYTDRPGFWLGAIGIAACWLGGAMGVADALEHASDRLDAHGRAHLGAVRACIATLGFSLTCAARQADAEGVSRDLERLALVVRATAADAVDEVIARVGRSLGPGPLAFDADHADRVADLQVFVRQHHGERDLARLGSLGSLDV